jgi:hypothetical protein
MKNALVHNLPLVALRLCDFNFLPNYCLSVGASLYKLPFLCQTSQYFTLFLIYNFHTSKNSTYIPSITR